MPDDGKADRIRNAHIWTSFGLCLVFWVLQLESGLLFGPSSRHGVVVLVAGHLVITALILAPLVLALRDGVPVRRLLSSLRVLFVLFMAVVTAVFMAVLLSKAIDDGTLLAPRVRDVS